MTGCGKNIWQVFFFLFGNNVNINVDELLINVHGLLTFK